MIKTLDNYRKHLLNQYLRYNNEEDYKKAYTCEMLIDLFDEMKLSVNEWHLIKTLANEFRSIQNATN